MSLIFLLIRSIVKLKKFMIDFSQISRISLIDLWKVKIYYGRSRFCYEQCRFYYEWSRYVITGQYFVMNSRDFDSDILRFYYKRSRFSWWQVEIFVMTGWDFFMIGHDFYDDRLRFSCLQVKILIMNRWDFRHDRSKSSWWFQVENFG